MGRFQILAREFFRLAAKEGRITAVAFLPLLIWRRLLHIQMQPGRELDPSGPEFDKHYGVDTGGVIPMAHFEVSDPNWIYGFGYQGVVPDELESVWPDLDIDYRNSVFIDLGSGKGRALMLASKKPFKRIIGVEISRELEAIASANLRIFGRQEQSAAVLELVCGDAANFEFPLDPLVLLLYNPFGTPIMRRVIANLIESLTAYPRPTVVIYVRPELAEMWDLVPGFSLVRSGPRLRIYNNRPMLGDCSAPDLPNAR